MERPHAFSYMLLSLQVIFRKRALWLAALLRKIKRHVATCLFIRTCWAVICLWHCTCVNVCAEFMCVDLCFIDYSLYNYSLYSAYIIVSIVHTFTHGRCILSHFMWVCVCGHAFTHIKCILSHFMRVSVCIHIYSCLDSPKMLLIVFYVSECVCCRDLIWSLNM